MLITQLPHRIRDIHREYPQQFWVLVGGTFIDRIGGALIFPFFSLYITKRFGVGMTDVGILFGLFSISSMVGGALGGALTDRLGRKGMLVFGLVASGLSSVAMGLVNEYAVFFWLAIFVGVLAHVAGPAQQAMVADLLPEEKWANGFGIIRVAMNLAVAIGPAIGSLLLTSQPYLLLFIGDAISSVITATIIVLAIRETRPTLREGEAEQTMGDTFLGYLRVLADGTYVLFLAISMVAIMVYMQMNSTLGPFLRDTHGVLERDFGWILTLNAGMVVFLQFPITRWISRYRPMAVMAVGTMLYAIGFGMYGFVSTLVLFHVAMVIITVGEMMTVPIAQGLVSRLAPEDMRGRYMAVFGFGWVIPSALGPLLAGLVMDNADPQWVWYGAGLLGSLAAVAYTLLERPVARRVRDTGRSAESAAAAD